MTEEEAIERFKGIVDIFKFAENHGWFPAVKTKQIIEDYAVLINILNLIENQKAEIEKKDAEYSDLKLKYEQNLRMCKHFREELNKQDKMIDLIYDFLYKFGSKFSGSFMKTLSEDGFDIKKCENCEYKICDCKECIKQYYERKVENGN